MAYYFCRQYLIAVIVVFTDEEDFDLGALFEGEDERMCMFCQTFGDQQPNVSLT